MDQDGYGSRPSDFMETERVAFRPEVAEANGWPEGGLVHQVGREWVHVRLDGTAKVIMVRPNRIRPIGV